MLQAFCLPILQIVHETLLDQREGKGARKSAHSSGNSTDYFAHEFVSYYHCKEMCVWHIFLTTERSICFSNHT